MSFMDECKIRIFWRRGGLASTGASDACREKDSPRNVSFRGVKTWGLSRCVVYGPPTRGPSSMEEKEKQKIHLEKGVLP